MRDTATPTVLTSYTKFYVLHRGTSAPTLPFSPWLGGWEVTGNETALLDGVKFGSANTIVTRFENLTPSPTDVGVGRFVTRQLAPQVISGTLDMVLPVSVNNVLGNFYTRVVATVYNDTDATVLATVLDYAEAAPSDVAWTTVNTGRAFTAPQALTPVTIPNDGKAYYLVVEVGARAYNTSSFTYVGQLRYGALDATLATVLPDLTLGATDTTARVGFLLFSTPVTVLTPVGAAFFGPSTVLIPGADSGEVAAILDRDTGAITGYWPELPTAETGDNLPSGIWALTVQGTPGLGVVGIYIYSPTNVLLAAVPTATLAAGLWDAFSPLRSNSVDRFYVQQSVQTAGVPATLHALGIDGSVLGQWTLPASANGGTCSMAPTRDNSLVYFGFDTGSRVFANGIGRFALAGAGTELTPLIPTSAGLTIGRDLFVTEAGDILLTAYPGPSCQVRRYAADGTLLATYPLPDNAATGDNLELSHDPTDDATFWVRTYPTLTTSEFYEFRISDGAQLTHYVVTSQTVAGDHLFIPLSCPFLIMPGEPDLAECVNGTFPMDDTLPTPIKRKFHLAADLGAYTLTGADAGLPKTGNRTLGVVPGDYRTTGAPAAFARSVPPELRTLTASPGTYATTGAAAVLGQPPVRTRLQLSHLSYLGAFQFPNTPGQEFVFANGSYAIRRVGGAIRFYGLGNPGWPHDQILYSFTYPGYTPVTAGNFASAVQASLIHTYASVPHANRPVASDAGYGKLWGLHWHGDTLYYTYATGYEGSSHNPAVGALTLDETAGTMVANGPWRATIHSGRFNNSLMAVPAWFQSAYGAAPVCQVAGMHSANGSGPWGICAYAFTPPAPGAPVDTIGGGEVSIAAQTLVQYLIGNPQPRDAHFKICYWADPSLAGPGGVPASYYCGVGNSNVIGPVPASQQFGGGGQILDWLDHATWIDTGTKHGLVCLGQLVDAIPGFPYPNGETEPHNWYGAGTCCHGHVGTPMWQGTGPGASTVVDYGWIVDPTDLAAVLAGTKLPGAVLPTETFQLSAIAGYPHGTKCDTLYKFGCLAYDVTAGLLFVSQINAVINAQGSPIPVMHVFAVAP